MSRLSATKIAAWFQIIVAYRRQESGLYREIAERLPLSDSRRVLDIGTGTGLQLRAIHDRQPKTQLFGLDLSAPAIEAARTALSNLGADLQSGNIAAAPYEDDFFDLVTCNASLSYWEDPRSCINEIYRILKPGGQALLFEPHREIDLDAALNQIHQNLRGQSPLRRWGAVQLNKYGLKRGHRLGMKLYSRQELIDLIRSTEFGENNTVEKTSLLNIPIFLEIQLKKPACFR